MKKLICLTLICVAIVSTTVAQAPVKDSTAKESVFSKINKDSAVASIPILLAEIEYLKANKPEKDSGWAGWVSYIITIVIFVITIIRKIMPTSKADDPLTILNSVLDKIAGWFNGGKGNAAKLPDGSVGSHKQIPQ